MTNPPIVITDLAAMVRYVDDRIDPSDHPPTRIVFWTLLQTAAGAELRLDGVESLGAATGLVVTSP